MIYISHRLDELFRIADDVLVMRDGQTIGTYPITELSVRKVVEPMVGGILTEERHERAIDLDAVPRLELVGLSRRWRLPRRQRAGPSGRDRRALRAGRLGCCRRPTRSTASARPTAAS